MSKRIKRGGFRSGLPLLLLLAIPIWPMWLVAQSASASDDAIHLETQPDSPSFQWNTQDLDLVHPSSPPETPESKVTQLKLLVQVRGKYAKPDSVIIYRLKKIAPREDGAFEILVPVEGLETHDTVQAVGPLGEIENQQLTIRIDSWPQLLAEFQERESAKRSRFGRLNTSLGYTFHSFVQSNTPDYSFGALTGKISYSYPLRPPRWDLGFNAFSTLYPFSPRATGGTASQRADLLDTRLWFIGANARVGYAVPFIKEPFRLMLHTGIYATTTLKSGPGRVGYQNLYGPQIFPTLRYALNPRDSFGTYVKYAPVTNGLAFDFPGHEVATGLSWTRSLPRERAFNVNVDYSNLTLTLVESGITKSLQSKALSLSAGYQW